MAKKLSIYHVAPEYRTAARAGFAGMRQNTPHVRVARTFRDLCLGAAIYYAHRAIDPKPEIIRVLMEAPALRQRQDVTAHKEAPFYALFLELEAHYNNPNTTKADFKALSPMGQETVLAMQSYEMVLTATEQEMRPAAKKRGLDEKRPRFLN